MPSRKDHYRNMFSQDDSPGLEAITRKQKDLYKEQEPTHWPTIVPYDIGGEDPLWAVNCFESDRQERHYHYITLGFTNLFYDENFAEDRVNGYGFELTFRHRPVSGDPENPVWPVNMLQNVARYVFKTHKTFEHFQFMSANGPLRLETKTDITAVVFHVDPEMGEIETPHGLVKFLQIFGITTNEYNSLRSGKEQVHDMIERHLAENPLLITDLSRTDRKR